MNKSNKLIKIKRARELRKEQTEAEQLLWKYLRDRIFFGNKFRRQHILKGFIVDFYCPEKKLVIELDGSVHLRQKDYDSARQMLIENIGVTFLRFNNTEIYNNILNVLTKVKEKVHPSLSPMEKGLTCQPTASTKRNED